MRHLTRLILTIFLMTVRVTSYAYDVLIDGIYYNLNSSTQTAEVTWDDDYEQYYSGTISIPSSVSFEGVSFLVTNIGEGAFSGCSGLISVTIPESVTSIGDGAFADCSGLISVTIPESVTSIGVCAFIWCSQLESIYIPSNVAFISGDSFAYCYSLGQIRVAESNSYYDSRDECNAVIETASNTLILGCNNTVIPNTVTSIGFHSFSSLTIDSIIFPNSLTEICDYAFPYCPLHSIDIPNSTTRVSPLAFDHCIELSEIRVAKDNPVYDSRNDCNAIIETATNKLICGSYNTIIPNTVTSIGDYAFSGKPFYDLFIPESVNEIGAQSLAISKEPLHIVIMNPIPPSSSGGLPETSWGGEDWHPNCCDYTLYVPIGSAQAYKSSDAWSAFTNIQEFDPEFCFDGVYYDIQPVSFAAKVLPSKGTPYQSVSIPDHIDILGCSYFTSIGKNVIEDFRSLTSIQLESLNPFEGVISSFEWNNLDSVIVQNPCPEAFSDECEYWDNLNFFGNVTYYVPTGTASLFRNSLSWKDVDKIEELEISFGGIKYSFDPTTIEASVIGYDKKKKNGSISIPEYVSHYIVTSIGDNAFSDYRTLSHIYLPENLHDIGSHAFSNCSSLTSITIPNSVKSIGGHAFDGCYFTLEKYINKSSLTDSNNWGATLCDSEQEDGLLIQDNVAIKCRTWATSVTIPNSVTSIGSGAFYGCTVLTSVTIPYSVTSIKDEAFKGCIGLNSVSIPYWTTSIGNSAFDGCTNLPVIDGMRYADTYLVESVLKDITSVIIKEETRFIGSSAFSNCGSLNSVIIPNSVTSISSSAFHGCSSLNSVFCYAEEVPTLGDDVFTGCPLSNATLYVPRSSIDLYQNAEQWMKFGSIDIIIFGVIIDDIYYNLDTGTKTAEVTGNGDDFSYDSYSGSVTIPATVTYDGVTYSVTSIGDHAFNESSGLTSVTIPSSVTSTGYRSFYCCSNLTSVNIPNSLTSIGFDSFRGCTGLQSLSVESGNMSYDSREGCNAIIETSTNSLILGCKNTTIPSSVTRIGDWAFDDCIGLTSVSIPSSVTLIGWYAFAGCSSLTEVYCYAEEVPIGIDLFQGCPLSTATLHVPAASIELYQNANEWRKFGTIIPISVEPTDLSTLDYAIYCPVTEVTGKKQFTLPISLKNQNLITSWQADLVLPEGFSLATDSYGDLMAVVSGDRTNASRHGITVKKMESGNIRLLFASQSNKEITGTDGEVATLTINIADDVAEDDYAITLKNILMVEKDETSHELEKCVSKVTIKYFTLGDPNNDGKINALDLVALVNFIFDNGGADNIFEAADMDGNGTINAVDYVALVNLIMSQPETAPTRGEELLSGYLSMNPWSLNAGEQTSTVMHLEDASADYTCVQFDMQLPLGIRIVNAESLSSSHALTYATLDNGSTRFLLASTANKSINTADGIIRLTFDADESMAAGEYSLTAYNTLFATAHCDAYTPADMSMQFSISNPSSISVLNNNATSVKAFNLSGQAIDSNAAQHVNGVYVIDGKKVTVSNK